MSGRHHRPRRAEKSGRRQRRGIAVAIAVPTVAILAAAIGVVATHDWPDTPAAAPSAPATTPAPDHSAELHSSFDALRFSAPVGVSIVPVGGGPALTFGDQSPGEAWSTIKIPLALAAERHGIADLSDAETRAIVDSDNDSAHALSMSLGSPAQTAEALTAVLRAGGDQTTLMPPVIGDDWPPIGATVWSLTESAAWTAKLPCFDDSGHILELMSNVSAVQDWGLRLVHDHPVAVKGGWGPDSFDDGYLVRQIGIVTRADGTGVSVSMSVHRPEMTYDAGVDDLNIVGDWIAKNLALLPGGTCPAPR